MVVGAAYRSGCRRKTADGIERVENRKGKVRLCCYTTCGQSRQSGNSPRGQCCLLVCFWTTTTRLTSPRRRHRIRRQLPRQLRLPVNERLDRGAVCMLQFRQIAGTHVLSARKADGSAAQIDPRCSFLQPPSARHRAYGTYMHSLF